MDIPKKDLCILALAQDIVLFPSLVVSIHLASPHATSLLTQVITNCGNSTTDAAGTILACIPRKATNTVQNALADAANRADTGSEDQLAQVIRLPTASSNGAEQAADELASGKIDLDDLFEYGTAVRIVRLERTSARQTGTAGFLVVLEGLARISYKPNKDVVELAPSDRAGAAAAAVPVYSLKHLTVHHPAASPALNPKDASLLAPLRDAAIAVLDALSGSTALPAPFERRLRTLVSRLSLASAPALIDALFGTLPISATANETPSALISADTTPNAAALSIGLTHADKLLILSLVPARARLEKAISILSRAKEGLQVRDRIDQSVARRQREFVLLQQLLAIRSELDQLAREGGGGTATTPGAKIGSKGAIAQRRGQKAVAPRKAGAARSSNAGENGDDEDEEEEDELAELERKIEAKHFSDEARKIAVRELKRLKKTPPQGAEHGVIRTYLETLLSIPWTDADSTPLPLSRDFVAQARKKLDQDHYGLDKIKKRLLEWLAVLRLQQQQWQADLANANANSQTALPTPASAPVTASTEVATAETALVLRDPSVPAPSAPSDPATNKPTSPPYKAPILLLHGPPGVGKTSIARSLAEAMGRKFIRISLGGVRDEAEIRGHRRTYVGAMPGKVVAALRKCGVRNPVVLLDEVDKMGHQSMHGDPSAAMLEVLDPEQNHAFEDHYLGVPVDLSQVLFIATANSLETIPEPLYDRMEAIELSGYVHDEKLHIARQSLLPKQLKANALSPSLVTISDPVLLHLITSYTREAGVRSLERHIGSVCRAKAVEFSEARDAGKDEAKAQPQEAPTAYRTEVTREDVERILGPPRFDEDEGDRDGRIGVVNGLAYQGSGNGGILSIETTAVPGSGKFSLTGQLGDVISESAHVAFAWVRAHAFELGITSDERENVFKSIDVHLHMPAGAVKKDGPSAGVAFTIAIISLMRGVAPRKGVAMTGEVTLRGAVTPVGGVREKVLAAHRSGMQRVILPSKNRRDIDMAGELPAQVKSEVEFVYVDAVEDAIEAAFEGGWAGVTGKPRVNGVGAHGQTLLESHL